MKKVLKFIIIFITFILSLTIFGKFAGFLGKGSKRHMAKLA
jgi:hypothetical protein